MKSEVRSDVAALATPLGDDVRESLQPLIDRIGNARCVMLGEASHGTSEFYTWRAEISKILIAEHGFSFVGVEGDWPDCYEVNRWVKGYQGRGSSAAEVLHAFARWPTWMWANREVQHFAEWLERYNQSVSPVDAAGFYGLDVYSLYESMDAVVEYLQRLDPGLAMAARRAYNCFEPFQEDAQEYARATYLVPTTCEDEAVEVLRMLRGRTAEFGEDDGRDSYFNAEQNAVVARNAEQYYRTMVRGGPASWNVRDHHMMETLNRLTAHHGESSKCIVWAHNTHIGDARYTDMSRAGMVNIGQLARQERGAQDVVLVGFGTHRGTVIAAEEWGMPMQRMVVPAARNGSWEDLILEAGCGDSLFIFPDGLDNARTSLNRSLEHRAIGVVYDPRRERWGNYVPTVITRRYDAFIQIEESSALQPLHFMEENGGEVAGTFPTGM
jgi:erythromycin esterase